MTAWVITWLESAPVLAGGALMPPKSVHMIRLLVGVLFLTLVGCAGPRPVTMTCSTFGAAAVVEPGQPIDLENFSVIAPQSTRWCLAYKGPLRATFGSHPLMGQYIEKPETSMALNTIIIEVRRVKHGAASLKNVDELQQFVEEWLERGFGVDDTGSEPIVSDTASARFTLVRSSVRPWRSLDADCVRTEYVMEERDNRIAPDKVLVFIADGPVCRHPAARDYLVVMGISERYERGKRIDPKLLETLKSRDAEPFFNSLKFAPAD